MEKYLKKMIKIFFVKYIMKSFYHIMIHVRKKYAYIAQKIMSKNNIFKGNYS